LAFVFVAKVAEFEVDRDKAFEFAVIEQQVNIKVIIIDLDAFLSGTKPLCTGSA
jgi:hypothetical protein